MSTTALLRTGIMVSFFIQFFCMSMVFSEDICKDWFNEHGLKQGPDCLLKCSSTSVGMGTFLCPQQCAELCKESTKTQFIHNIAYYPGLTASERALIAKDPKTSWKVFKMKNEAEKATEKRFKRSLERDESDAFRHFVWAGLLRWEISLTKARVYTEAHEMRPFNPEDDKAMDLANNRAGILAAEELEKAGKKTFEALQQRGLTELKNKQLIVLERKGIPK